MNQFVFMGRLGRDPEMVERSGLQITTVNIATDRSKKSGDTYEKVTDWHRVKFFGKKAEVVNKFFTKGKQILCYGNVQPWAAEKDGEKKYGIDFIAKEFEFVGDKSNSENRSSNDSHSSSGPGKGQEEAEQSDDELPF
jgi:single-strand DNA-binding protein